MALICVLLPSSIKNDARVIKTIRTISKKHEVHLYYVDNTEEVTDIFNDRVTLYRIEARQENFKNRIISHSFFYRVHMYFVREVISRNQPYDVVFANDLPTLLPARKLAKHFKAKLVYDSHEIYCETINQFFPSNPKHIKKLFYAVLLRTMQFLGSRTERKLLHHVDEFITVNKSILDYFKSIYKIKNGHVIMNLPMAYESDKSSVDFRAQFNWSKEDTIFIYQGVLNNGRGLKLLIQCIANQSQNIKLIIVGHGSMYNELQFLVKELNACNKIKFVGRISLKELPVYTRGADIGFNLLEDLNLSKKLASPNKLFEYIHAGIPVICSNSLENAKVLNKFHVGTLVENNPKSIEIGMKEVIKGLKTNEYKSALQSCAAYYAWQKQEPLLLKLFE